MPRFRSTKYLNKLTMRREDDGSWTTVEFAFAMGVLELAGLRLWGCRGILVGLGEFW